MINSMKVSFLPDNYWLFPSQSQSIWSTRHKCLRWCFYWISSIQELQLLFFTRVKSYPMACVSHSPIRAETSSSVGPKFPRSHDKCVTLCAFYWFRFFDPETELSLYTFWVWKEIGTPDPFQLKTFELKFLSWKRSGVPIYWILDWFVTLTQTLAWSKKPQLFPNLGFQYNPLHVLMIQKGSHVRMVAQ